MDTEILRTLRNSLAPALGVTEPAAVALGAAEAYRAVGGEIKRITLKIDPALYKMGHACMIPGTRRFGLEIAAALGAIAGQPDLRLQVLQGVDADSLTQAVRLVEAGNIRLEVLDDHEGGIHIDAQVTTSRGNGVAVILDSHDNVVFVSSGEERVYDARRVDPERGEKQAQGLEWREILSFVRRVDPESIQFVLDMAGLNQCLLEEGLAQDFGLGVGRAMSRLGEACAGREALEFRARRDVAAACDARLGGASVPAMSLAGSGSHGITASLPILAVAADLGVSEVLVARSLALSFLLTIHLKSLAGRLSAFCGCAATAAVGASAGLALLLGGSNRQIGNAAEIVAADVTGIICDGANFGCSLKTSTGAGSAVRAALLAMENIAVPPQCGIVGAQLEETLLNIGRISVPGMRGTDKTILEILQSRQVSEF